MNSWAESVLLYSKMRTDIKILKSSICNYTVKALLSLNAAYAFSDLEGGGGGGGGKGLRSERGLILK